MLMLVFQVHVEHVKLTYNTFVQWLPIVVPIIRCAVEDYSNTPNCYFFFSNLYLSLLPALPRGWIIIDAFKQSAWLCCGQTSQTAEVMVTLLQWVNHIFFFKPGCHCFFCFLIQITNVFILIFWQLLFSHGRLQALCSKCMYNRT